jgi:Tfp pilus assembly protein PilV
MELMIAALILALTLVGLLASYISCMQLTEITRNTSIAINIVQAKAEEIEGHTYANIKADYDRITFTPSGLNGIGVSYVDDTNPNLLKITVSLSWRQSRGRVIGEDADLNGQWNTGEDTLIVNNILDSPAEIVTYIAQR